MARTRREAVSAESSTTRTTKNKYSTPAVEKAFAVLEFISRHEQGARMVDVVEMLGLPKSSTFVILSALEQLGYLTRDAVGRYRLTLRMFELGTRAMRNVDVTGIAAPYLEKLRDETGLTVHLASRDHDSVVYLAKVDGPGFVRFDTYVGKRAPLHLTGVGKALAAHLPEEEIDRLAQNFDFGRGTANSAKSLRAFKAGLKKVRAQGYALDDEEEVPGVRCVAAPVRNHLGDPVVSVGVIGLAQDLVAPRLEQISRSVVTAASALSARLGASSEEPGV